MKKKSQQQILKELFSYIFNDNTPSDKLRNIDNERRSHITKKIQINFPTQNKSASRTFLNNLVTINLIKRFIEDQLKIDDQPFFNLVDRIQTIYIQLKESDDINIPVLSLSHFDTITKKLLKLYEMPQKIFFAEMRSVVLYIFEICDFGKVPVDTDTKLPKPISPPTLFDESEE